MPEPPRVESQWKAERERLASELHRLEEALSDAREGAGGEEESSLVARLREATRKRVRVEEEFERSSDRWRDERRNLNAEIDRLDRALQKAQTDARRNRSADLLTDSKTQSDLKQALRIRDEAQGRLEEERSRWESERGALETRIADLESGLVDALDRAHNLSRGDEARDAAIMAEVEAKRQAIESQARARFEASVEEARQRVGELEEERGQLHLEIHRLKSDPAAEAFPDAEPASQSASRLSLKERLRGRRRAQNEGSDESAELAALEMQVASLDDRLRQETRQAEEATSRLEAAEARVRELDARAQAGDRRGLEDAFSSQEAAWEAERADLEGRVLELESSLEQARQAGPPAEAGGLRNRLEESERSLSDLTRQFSSDSSAWNREREELEGRIHALDASLSEARSAGASSVEAAGEVAATLAVAEDTIRSLEKKLDEESREREEIRKTASDLESALAQSQAAQADNSRQQDQLLAEFEEARQQHNEFRKEMDVEAHEWKEERAGLIQQVGDLQASLKDARHTDASSDAKAQKLVAGLEASEQKLANAAGEWSREKKALEAAVQDLEQRLGEAARLSSPDEALSTRIEELEASLADSAAEAGRVRAALEEQLRSQAESWQTERRDLNDAIRDLNAELTGLRKAQVQGSKAGANEESESAASRGIASFGKVLSSLGGGAGDKSGGKSVADLEARRQALEVRLEDSEGARSALADKLQMATEEWETERGKLEVQLGEMNEAIRSASEKEHADLDARHAELLTRLEEAETRYTALEESSMASARAWDEQRGQLENEIRQWEQQVVAEAERVAGETRKALAGEYEKQLRELRSQKEQLESQLRSSAPSHPGGSVDPQVVAAEMARVDAEIEEINHLIEDPNAALSNVMRKNAERSELKAYRRGLSYLAERFTKSAKEPAGTEDAP